ncbi:MAG TPA: class I SAM-dependent methyltransferase [Mycobacteriales bacterium]|nr:class I SAM-dependent methyltransferase [Mycobacteriales bacterium]
MSIGTNSRPGEYQLGLDTDLTRTQLTHLEALLDAKTCSVLDTVGVRPGHRCLDLGAGSGTITRALADRAGAAEVVAVDLDTRHLRAVPPPVRVLEHDINDGVRGGPYDLIHARLVLMHLARRAEILHELAAALAPGGWLVIGEYVGPQRHVVRSPTSQDEALFHRVQHIAHGMASAAGVSYTWAFEVAGHMSAAGLTGVHATDDRHTAEGGSDACRLSWNYLQQLRPRLLEAGLTPDELERYHALMLDPRFCAWFYPFICSRGQKPPAP